MLPTKGTRVSSASGSKCFTSGLVFITFLF
jgi:hypothetical protein